MERLTARSPINNAAYLVNIKDDEQVLEGAYNTLVCLKEAFDRLAAYEDSGLTTDEVQEFAKVKADEKILQEAENENSNAK